MRRELWVVAGYWLLLCLPFLGKPFHVDEPFFLAVADQILRDPLHPFAFEFNWYEQSVPMAEINNTPPLFYYLLAVLRFVSGDREWLLRLLYLPVSALAAAGLYALASCFLRQPFWPTLILISTPAYFLSMSQLYPEVQAAALGFWGLSWVISGTDNRDPSRLRNGLLLLSLALLSKYSAAVLLAPAAAYIWAKGAGWRKTIGYASIVLAPLGIYLAWDELSQNAVLQSAWNVTQDRFPTSWPQWAHKMRAFLAFIGGGGVVTVFWPLWSARRRAAVQAVGLLLCGLLFSPWNDSQRVPTLWERGLGVIMAWGALLSIINISTRWTPKREERSFWTSWAFSLAALQVALYWSVLSRVTALLLPALILPLASVLEKEDSSRGQKFYRGSLALTGIMALVLGLVDLQFARAQKDFAHKIAGEYSAAGKRVWFTGHWGLQYYLEKAGAQALDIRHGAWEAVQRGDIVVLPRANSNIIYPRRLPDDVELKPFLVGCPIPLRLIRLWSGQAAFYSSAWGFLPYAPSGEALEEFVIAVF